MNIFITGALRGMGLNHAKIFNKSNNNLFLTDISKSASNVFSSKIDNDNLENIFKSSNNIKVEYGDLTNYRNANKITKSALKWFKNDIDVIICNAGGDIPGKSLDGYSDKAKINDYMVNTNQFLQIFERNFLTTFNMVFLSSFEAVISKKQISSALLSLYIFACSAGSPASTKLIKLIPLTTLPFLISKQGIILFFNI